MKIATLDLTPELFIEFAKLCKDGPPRRLIVSKNPLPDDAEIVDIRLRSEYPQLLRLVIKSEVFEDVEPDAEPPQLPDVWFETQFDEATQFVA